MEQYYSLLFHQPVTAELKNDTLLLRKYSPGFDGYREREFKIRKQDLAYLAKLFEENCRSFSALGQFPFLKKFLNTAVIGSVDFIAGNRAYINVRNGFIGKILGVCLMENIPPKERTNFKGFYRFYVCGLDSFEKEPALMLSRTTKKLVEKLFEEKEESVRCIHRIAGAKSEVTSQGHISQEHIKSVSDELRERIIVRYQK